MPDVGAQFRREERVAAEAKQARTAMRRRQRWEKANPDRMKTAGSEHGLAPGQMYEARGWSESSAGPMAGERQLPGLEDPLAAPHPTRWEDLPAAQQAKAQAALRTRAGATPDSMRRSFGAQLDQSYERAQRNAPKGEAGVPFSRDFYTEGETAQVMRESAKRLDIPVGVHVAVNAFTSPQTKFKHGDRYPNLETAESVVAQHRAGVPSSEVTTGRNSSDPTKGNQGFHTNAKKAAHALEQHDAGVPLRDWKTHSGTSMFGPKTGPYHNSWLEGTPDFFVSDVHSGGGGMLPHLSSEKKVRHDDTGQPIVRSGKSVRAKSERETAIERVPHFHAMADWAARQAMLERGLTKTRQAQASQWGEEQIQRTARAPKLALAKESDSYPPKVGKQFRQIPGQSELF